MRCRAARALVFRFDLHAIGGHCRDNMNLVADADFELAAVAGDQERVRASDGDLRDDWLAGSRRMCAAEACNSNGSAAEEERTIVPRSRTAIEMPGAWCITALLCCSRENWLAPKRTRNHPRESVASVSPLKMVAPVAATPEPTEAFWACRTTPSAAEGAPYTGASTSVTTSIATRQLRNSACTRTSER